MYSYTNKYPGTDNGISFGGTTITANGNFLVAGDSNASIVGLGRGKIIVYNLPDFTVKGNVIRGTVDNEQIGEIVAINEPGDRVFSTCRDNSFRVWHYNIGTNIWDLVYTDSQISFAYTSNSIRCNASGTEFVSSYYDIGSLSTGFVKFFSYDGSSWSPNVDKNVLPNENTYWFNIDIDSSLDTVIGASAVNASSVLVQTWDSNTTSWVAKGGNISDGNRPHSVALSADGDTAVLLSFSNAGFFNVYIFDWNGISWVPRGSINAPTSHEVFWRIYVSNDKNTICFSGIGQTDPIWGIWSWDGISTWNQDLSFYNELVAGTNVNNIINNHPPSMSGDKSIAAAAYFDFTDFSVGFATFTGPTPPLITPVTDDFTSTPFNVSTFNQKLIHSPPKNILTNDLPDAVTAATGTINPTYTQAGDQIIETNGNFRILATHPVGDFTFSYTVTDTNSTESGSVDIDYRVINYGLDTLAIEPVEDIYINELSVLLTTDAIINPILASGDFPGIAIHIELLSGDFAPADYTADQVVGNGSIYDVTLTSAGPQQVRVTYSYLGEELSFTRSFNVLDLPVAVDDFSIGSPYIIGSNGGTTSSIIANDTTTQVGYTVSIVDDDGLTGVTYNSGNGGLVVPVASTPGDYVVTYKITQGSKDSNVASVFIRVTNTPSFPSSTYAALNFLITENPTIAAPPNNNPVITNTAGLSTDAIISIAILGGLGVIMFLWLLGII